LRQTGPEPTIPRALHNKEVVLPIVVQVRQAVAAAPTPGRAVPPGAAVPTAARAAPPGAAALAVHRAAAAVQSVAAPDLP